MIIDIHTHIAFDKIYPSTYMTGMLEVEKNGLDNEQAASFLSFFLRDKNCEQLIKQMDKAKIGKAVLLIIDGGLGIEEPEYELETIFKLHHEVLLRHPDRFIVFAGIDPRRGKKGFMLFKRAVIEYGFKGLKLYPPMGYSMFDKRLYKYYQFCSDHNLTVLIHTGPSLKFLKNRFAVPKLAYQVAKDFPKVNFILAHLGYNLSDSATDILIPLQNVFFDIAGFQSYYNKVDERMRDNLGKIFSEEFNKKIIFGSDWPLFNMISPISKHIQLLQELFYSLDNPVLDGLDNVLYKNAMRALNLT
jgi:uncharacterized protein